MVKGWKAFDRDLRCRHMQFKVGKKYRHKGKIELCKAGFHFHEKATDIYTFYPMGSRVYENR